MEDWDVHLLDAFLAAQHAAEKPLTHAMLHLCSRDIEVPFSGPPKAMARLLDIAILTSNQKATVNLSKKCQLWPLRRWVMDWDVQECWKAAMTAMWAGADFQDLMVLGNFWGSPGPRPSVPSEDIPFPQALFLRSKLEDWQEIRHLLPACHDLWSPRSLLNELAWNFLDLSLRPYDTKLSLDKICAAEDAGLELQFLSLDAGGNDDYARVNVLDMAILCGQPDCAEAVVDAGIELWGDDTALAWHKRVLRGESLHLDDPLLNVVPSEAEIAAAAAGRSWLKRLWKSESSQKGIVLYQMMLKMFKGKSFPMLLVQEILTFSMPVPKIIDQLDLWEHVGGWVATICGRPAVAHPAGDCKTENVEEPEGMQDNDEAEGNGEAGATSGDATETDVKATEDLMTALRASRDQVPALNVDGVCLFRLTRMGTCPHVTDLLLDATGPLQPLHTRVLEAGCEVNPSWNPVKVLFVPLTEGQMVELQGLAAHGYELSNEYHVLALQSDEELIADALRSNIRNKNRPKLKKVGPEVHPETGDANEEEDGPLLVLEASGTRTDSDRFYPSYPTGSSQ